MNYFKFMRLKHYYSQMELANKLNISQSKIAKMENNNEMFITKLNYKQLKVLASLYNITVDEMMTEYEKDIKYTKNDLIN